MASPVIAEYTIKGKLYKIHEYNWARNEYFLTEDGSMVLEDRSKDECIEKILELVKD